MIRRERRAGGEAMGICGKEKSIEPPFYLEQKINKYTEYNK